MPEDLVNVADFERAAAERLEAGVLGYFAGGAGDELTLRDNVAAWGRWRLRPRMLAGIAEWERRDRAARRRALDADPRRPGRLPAAGRSRGRGGDGAGRGRGRHGDVPLDPGDGAARRGRRGGARRPPLVPALLLQRRGGDDGADGKRRRVRLRGDRRHRRRAAGGQPGARLPHRLRAARGARGAQRAGGARRRPRGHGAGGVLARSTPPWAGPTSRRSPPAATCPSWSRAC